MKAALSTPHGRTLADSLIHSHTPIYGPTIQLFHTVQLLHTKAQRAAMRWPYGGKRRFPSLPIIRPTFHPRPPAVQVLYLTASPSQVYQLERARLQQTSASPRSQPLERCKQRFMSVKKPIFSKDGRIGYLRMPNQDPVAIPVNGFSATSDILVVLPRRSSHPSR